MKPLDHEIFRTLLKEAHFKCFGHALSENLSETDSKFFSNEILEATGLTIGWKSLKNYTSFVLKNVNDKQENPSVATLDTLARYVLNAPFTSETQRKNDEGHFPFWFRYKDQFAARGETISTPSPKLSWKKPTYIGGFLVFVIAVAVYLFYASRPAPFIEEFRTVSEDSLFNRGWFLKSKDSFYWNKRNEKSEHLALFTLQGDNWPDSVESPGIKNLLLRKIPYDCFTLEAQLTNFIPAKNWQQAGVLLLEDTTFKGKSIRMSLAYNDFFGGYSKPKEILIQTITSNGSTTNKPEEISHYPLFAVATANDSLSVIQNLQYSSFRIEKKDQKWRFLFAGGQTNNTAFKEIVSHEFDFQPKYVGLFALKGFVPDSTVAPAYFKLFSLTENGCDN
ncbi:hypothetical protein [Runella sp.]|uniref:hypothetical protein n=1 Tax=Runella sp. TaxID=1960881 RepID=UPI003D11F98D